LIKIFTYLSFSSFYKTAAAFVTVQVSDTRDDANIADAGLPLSKNHKTGNLNQIFCYEN